MTTPTIIVDTETSRWLPFKPARPQRRSSIEAIPRPQSGWSHASGTALRLAWKLILLASLVFTVLGMRFIVFEYAHGGREMAARLFGFLLP